MNKRRKVKQLTGCTGFILSNDILTKNNVTMFPDLSRGEFNAYGESGGKSGSGGGSHGLPNYSDNKSQPQEVLHTKKELSVNNNIRRSKPFRCYCII